MGNIDGGLICWWLVVAIINLLPLVVDCGTLKEGALGNQEHSHLIVQEVIPWFFTSRAHSSTQEARQNQQLFCLAPSGMILSRCRALV